MVESAGFLDNCLRTADRVLPDALQARPHDLQAARQLTALAAIAGICAPLLCVMYHFLGFDAAGVAVLLAGSVMFVSPLCMRSAAGLPVARDLFVGALYLLKIWLALRLGGVAAPTTPWFLLCPLVAMLVGGPRAGLAWSGLVALTVLAIFIAGDRLEAIAHPVASPRILDLVSLLGLFAIATIIGLFFRANANPALGADSVHGAAGAGATPSSAPLERQSS